MGWRRGQPYSQDLRDRVLACGDMTLVQVATRFGAQHGHVPLRLAGHTDALQAQIKACPDATLNELRSWLSQERQVAVSYPVLWKVVARLGLTLKKSTSRPKSSNARMS